jgi:hypothetical protein
MGANVLKIWSLAWLVMAVTGCGVPQNSIEAQTAREAAAANCDSKGKCVKDPSGLVLYNSDLVTENFVLKRPDQNPTLLTRLMNLIDEPKLLVTADKLEPLIRGVAIVGEFEPCDSPKGIDGANPAIGQLRSLKQGRYKACITYIGDGLFKKAYALSPIDVDTTPPEVSKTGVHNPAVTPTTASLTWSKAGDNLTLDGQLIYSVYTSKTNVLDSLEAVRTHGNLVPGLLIGGMSYTITSLSESTNYHAAVVVTDEAGNQSLVGNSNFRTTAADTNPPTSPSVVINSNASHTSTTAANLTLSAGEASEMYVTTIDGCTSGGTWEPYVTSKSWTLAQTNAAATVFAKFKDLAGNETACVSDTIIHDDIAPTAPNVTGATSTNDTTPSWSWTSGGGGNGTYRYKLNNADLTTGASETTDATFTASQALSEGTHTLYVQERDAAGNWSASGSHEISVVTPPSAPILSTPTSVLNGLSLSWVPSDGATSYNLYWSNSAGVNTTSTKITGVSSGYTHSALSVQNNYFYRVSAIKSGVESALSNEVSGTPQASSLNDPVISVTNYQSLTVSIAPPTSGETIFYTLDNSNPTQSSTTYTGPFSIQPTQTVKAIAIKSGYAPSAVVSYNPNFDSTEDFAGTFVKYLNRFSGQDNLNAWQAPDSTPAMPSISTSPPAGPPSSAALYATSGEGLYSLTSFGQAGSILPSLTQDFTIEMWVYFSSINASTLGSQGSATQWALDGVSIAASILRAADGDPFNIVVLVDGGIAFQIVQDYDYASSSPVRSVPGLIKTGQWHHFAASVKSGQYSRIFVDGKPVISTSVTPVSNNNAPYEWLDGSDFNLSSALYISNMRLTQFARYESEFSPQFVDFSASPASDTTAPVISAASVTTLSPGTTRTPGVTFTSNETGTYQLFSVAGCGSGSVSASATMLAASNSATTNLLTSNVTTTIYVRATDVMGNSSCNLVGTYIHDNAPPLTPVIADTSKSFNASFTTEIAQNSPPDANFKEFRYTTNGLDPTCSAGTASTTQPTSVVITAATTTLKAIACDLVGLASTVVATSVFTYDITPPNAPAVTGTTPTANTTPTWSWSSGGNGGNGTYRYKLNDANLSSGATETASTTFTPGSALPEATYMLYVQERDAAGNWSASGSFAIQVVTPPAAPTLSTPTRYVTSLGLSWASVAGATSYNLYWSTTAGVTTSSTKISGVVSIHMHTSLTGGTTYYYKLAAVKSGIEGALSNEVSASPYSYAAPTVTAISPNSGSASGGTAVTITGTGFVSGSTVSIGGANATGVTFGSSTSLTATTPARSSGAQNVVVTNPDGQTGTLASGFTYLAAACVGDCYLEGSSPNFAQDLAIGTERLGPSGTTLTLQFANGSSGFKVWKEKAGNRILNASGLASNGWQQTLTRAGTAFNGTDFTVGANITGRVCPTHVFLSQDNMIATNRCLYYDNGNAAQALDAARITGTEASDWLQDWDRAATGRGIDSSYYEGNIKTCADKGMRLPTMYETTMTVPTSDFPTGDGITPTWAGSTKGVPSQTSWTWTASAQNDGPITYWTWSGTSSNNDDSVYDSSFSVRCVLPNSTPPWSDVTVGSDITMRDNATGLWWSNYRGAMNWDTAMSHCGNLSYNGASAGSWRVPTKDELVAASNNGISAQGRTGWITNFNSYFWSSVSDDGYGAWDVVLANGYADYGGKYLTDQVVCVR